MRKPINLPIIKFDGNQIDNCFYIQRRNDPNSVTSIVSMNSVFEWIKQKAVEEGLTIELQENIIIFTPGNV